MQHTAWAPWIFCLWVINSSCHRTVRQKLLVVLKAWLFKTLVYLDTRNWSMLSCDRVRNQKIQYILGLWTLTLNELLNCFLKAFLHAIPSGLQRHWEKNSYSIFIQRQKHSITLHFLRTICPMRLSAKHSNSQWPKKLKSWVNSPVALLPNNGYLIFLMETVILFDLRNCHRVYQYPTQ